MSAPPRTSPTTPVAARHRHSDPFHVKHLRPWAAHARPVSIRTPRYVASPDHEMTRIRLAARAAPAVRGWSGRVYRRSSQGQRLT